MVTVPVFGMYAGCVTLTVYVPGGRSSNVAVPVSSVVAVFVSARMIASFIGFLVMASLTVMVRAAATFTVTIGLTP